MSSHRTASRVIEEKEEEEEEKKKKELLVYKPHLNKEIPASCTVGSRYNRSGCVENGKSPTRASARVCYTRCYRCMGVTRLE